MFKHTLKRFKIAVAKGFDENTHKEKKNKQRYKRLAVLKVENLNSLI